MINHTYAMKASFKKKKKKKDWVQRVFGLVNTWKFQESGAFGKGMEALHPFPLPCPVHLFHLAVPELYPFMINWQSNK